MKILVTGVAGFIGMHVALLLLERGDEVIGVDNLNNYYSSSLKKDRLKQLKKFKNFKFIKLDISNTSSVNQLFQKNDFQNVINLAAQPGIRHSLKHAGDYIQANLVGFANILEACRHHKIQHLVYASSSSVYGNNVKKPFSTLDNVDHPLNLYAATKRSNELMAHAYSHVYGLPTTGLRFFTAYGPWGRPDMSPWLFTSAILEQKVIDIFNYGNMFRDFTYIDDIAISTVLIMDSIAKPNSHFNPFKSNPGSSFAPYKIYNIGSQNKVKLIDFINTLEKILGINAVKNFLPMQDGDATETQADISTLIQDINFKPKITLEEGLKNWVSWYREYHK